MSDLIEPEIINQDCILKFTENNIKDIASTNIVNKCGTTINIGAPGDTTKLAANTIRSNALQNACGGNTISKWLSEKKEIEVKKLKKQYNKKIKVDITTIEKYCKKNKIESIDFLKLDTQTHERECLLGAKSLLDKIKVIYTEINFFDMYEMNYNFFDLESIIVPKGFNLYSISRISDEKKSDKIGWVEAVYLNKKYF